MVAKKKTGLGAVIALVFGMVLAGPAVAANAADIEYSGESDAPVQQKVSRSSAAGTYIGGWGFVPSQAATFYIHTVQNASGDYLAGASSTNAQRATVSHIAFDNARSICWWTLGNNTDSLILNCSARTPASVAGEVEEPSDIDTVLARDANLNVANTSHTGAAYEWSTVDGDGDEVCLVAENASREYRSMACADKATAATEGFALGAQTDLGGTEEAYFLPDAGTGEDGSSITGEIQVIHSEAPDGEARDLSSSKGATVSAPVHDVAGVASYMLTSAEGRTFSAPVP